MTRITPAFLQTWSNISMITFLYIGLTVVYLGGAWTFWKGFNRTHFSRSIGTRIGFAVLWPVLFAANKNFRKNFQKALRGD
jgi:hypothetical protein